MTRTHLDAAGVSWTVTLIPPSIHRKKPGPRVWLSFTSETCQKRLPHPAAGFDLATADGRGVA